MEPQPPQNFPQNPNTLVNQIHDFIRLIKQFKDSNLAQNPQIIQIYKENDLDINQKPNVWQTFIYSVRKFSQKPFETGKSIFQIIFLLIFCPYFSSKHIPDQIINSQPNNIEISQQSQTNKTIETKDYQNSISELVLKKLKQQQLPTFKQWVILNSYDIKKLKHQDKDKYETMALIQQVKKTQNLMTLEYIINTNTCLLVINYKQKNDFNNEKLLSHAMIKHSEFETQKLTVIEYQIFNYLKLKFYSNCSHQSPNSCKIHPIKLLNIIVRAFALPNTPYQQTDIRFYMHLIHKVAERYKNFFLANMIRSKCFVCQAERYSSNSIHKIRIYQCLSRKLINAVSEVKKQPLSNLIVQSTQNQQIMFNSSENQEKDQC